jgi:5-formyltetrahydrofolate cyclo-ligase
MEDLDRPMPGMRYYLAMWCSTGFESLVDIGEIWSQEEQESKDQLWDILSSNEDSFKKKPLRNTIARMVSSMKLRARVNSQRNYEIYCFMTDDSIPASELNQLVESDPQLLVDMIRDHGIRIYGHAAAPNQVLIK